MDLKQGCRVRRSCFLSHPPQHHPHHQLPHRHRMCHCHSLHICAHHHHHHHHHHLHHRHYHRCQHPQRQFIAHPHVSSHVTSFPRNPEPSGAVPLPNNLDFGASGCEEACSSATLMLQEQEQEWLEEEDDDEPVFVLTDEWREFFAKSEAKRKLEKKQAKKKGKQ